MQLLVKDVLINHPQRTLRIVLAESNLLIRQSLVDELKKKKYSVRGCATCQEIDQAFSNEVPDLLLIGTIEDLSCFEACRKYANEWQDLPIFLLSHQVRIAQSFKDLLISRGVFDVLSCSPENLHLIHEALCKVAEKLSPVSAQEMLGTLNIEEVNDFSAKEIKEFLEITELNRSQNPSYADVLLALNQITESSMDFFGGMVISNYWKKAHAAVSSEYPWLQSWAVAYRGEVEYSGKEIPQAQLTDQQFQAVKFWAQGFLKECDRIVVDYVNILGAKKISTLVNQIISS
jgi:DNA-binding NarL/FixJ family response regulator